MDDLTIPVGSIWKVVSGAGGGGIFVLLTTKGWERYKASLAKAKADGQEIEADKALLLRLSTLEAEMRNVDTRLETLEVKMPKMMAQLEHLQVQVEKGNAQTQSMLQMVLSILLGRQPVQAPTPVQFPVTDKPTDG